MARYPGLLRPVGRLHKEEFKRKIKMSMSDPIADMLTRLRNALLVNHEKVSIPKSSIKIEIAKILKDEGFIKNYRIVEDGSQGTIRIYLAYRDGYPLIDGLKRISTPGSRKYAGKEDIPEVLNGKGIVILSTSQGIMTGTACQAKNIGGELLCSVW